MPAKHDVILNNGFQTTDGRFPYYIRTEQEAREEYKRLLDMQFQILRPGKVLSLDEFLELASSSGSYELVRPNDPNDDGYTMLASFDSPDEAKQYFSETASSDRQICSPCQLLDEEAFVEMATEGKEVNLAKIRPDKTIRVLRGIMIGVSESFVALLHPTREVSL